MAKGVTMAKKKNTYSLILVLIVISFMGFCVENIFTALTHGFINNKNIITNHNTKTIKNQNNNEMTK